MTMISDRKSSHQTLAGLLRARAGDRPDHGLYTFLAHGEEEAGGPTHAGLARRAPGPAAVPAYPPRLHRTDERLAEIFRDARPRAVLTTSALLGRLATQEELAGARQIAVDQIPDSLADAWREPDLGAGDVAFLQYTSG